MSKPILSIIVPIYGTEKYIARCAHSLFSQASDKIEYVFVNDCTPDNALSILKNIIQEDKTVFLNVKIINHDYNQGLGAARLTGLNHSTGEYVWFVDSDDFVEQNAIQTLMPFFDRCSNLITFSFFEEKNHSVSKYVVRNVSVERLLRTQIPATLWKCVFRRKFLFLNNIFPIQGINYAEDFHVLAKALLVSEYTIELSDKYLYHYECSNQNSLMHQLSTKAYESCADAVMSVYEFYKSHGAVETYRYTLAAMLVQKYLDLKKSDSNNPRLNNLLSSIKELSLSYYLIFRSGAPLKLQMQLARVVKVITAGRDSKL